MGISLRSMPNTKNVRWQIYTYCWHHTEFNYVMYSILKGDKCLFLFNLGRPWIRVTWVPKEIQTPSRSRPSHCHLLPVLGRCSHCNWPTEGFWCPWAEHPHLTWRQACCATTVVEPSVPVLCFAIQLSNLALPLWPFLAYLGLHVGIECLAYI